MSDGKRTFNQELIDSIFISESPFNPNKFPSQLMQLQISETQWKDYLNLVSDLELNRAGAKILLEEYLSGKVKIGQEQ